MTYRGHVKNGSVVLDNPVSLPEGAQVEVDVKTAPTPTLTEKLKRHAGKAVGLPADASRNVDHYLYGSPKR